MFLQNAFTSCSALICSTHTAVGDSVGVTEGAAEGLFEGLVEGLADGAADGVADGLADGPDCHEDAREAGELRMLGRHSELHYRQKGWFYLIKKIS